MTDINNFKQKKAAKIQEDLKELNRIHSEYLQQEMIEKNTGKVNIEKIVELTSELKDMNTNSENDAYSPESFM